MSNHKTVKTSGEIYLSLCKNRRSLIPRTHIEDVKTLFNTILEELLMSFESPLLNACYSVLLRCSKQRGIDDCTYLPRSFRLIYSNEPYALPNNDAYSIFRLLAGVITDEDIRPDMEKWFNTYLGKKYDYPNPTDYCIDALLKRIDDGLVQLHRNLVQQQTEQEHTLSREHSAQQIIQAARIKADSILAQANEQSKQIVAQAKKLEQQASRLRKDGELAARAFYIQAEKAEQLRKQQAEECLKQTRQEAEHITAEAARKADEILAASEKRAEALMNKFRARANAIVQKAAEEKLAAQNVGLNEGIELVIRQFSQTQDAMRALEAQFDQVQLMKIFDTFYSLYELIDLNKKSMETLPEEYSYISENMEVFLEVIQEGLADFGIQTIISAPESPFVGKLHEAQGSTMFDPAQATIKRSLCPGFLNSATDHVLKKEQVEIICK